MDLQYKYSIKLIHRIKMPVYFYYTQLGIIIQCQIVDILIPSLGAMESV